MASAATALRMAGEERERQGDYRASVLLDEWASRVEVAVKTNSEDAGE